MNRLFSIIILLSVFIISNSISYSQQYVLVGWNDLGMHCANKDFSKMAVLPPYNDVYAQLILRATGQLPQIVRAGYTIEYSVPGNTYSVGKTNFWTYAQQLFGLPQPLPNNIGLTGHGLTGTLDTGSTFFRALGIPVTPYPDNDLINEHPFQLFHLIAKQGNTTLTFTENVIPISNEISCIQSGCHSSEQSIMNEHPDVAGFNPNQPTLCASCHASNALGTVGDSLAKPFSFRMHDTHSFMTPSDSISLCYKCHPGPNTQCLRDVMRVNFHLVCQNCHGTMNIIANSIRGGRRPWLDEPKCVTCHGNNYAEEPGQLYRNSKGHGGVYCAGCHGSPHAFPTSREANDNAQNIRLQGFSGPLRDCMVCHSSTPSGPGPHGILPNGINPISTEIPASFRLFQNFPNPFNPSTKIKFSLPNQIEGGAMQTRLAIYDALGREVAVLVNQQLQPGIYEVNFEGSNLSSGIYFYRITAGNWIDMKKMVLVK